MTVIKDAGAFAPPPDHAPREVSQPLSADAVAEMQAKAAQNEQPLPPFAPKAAGRQPVPVTPAEAKILSPRRPVVDAVAVETVTPEAQAMADAVTATSSRHVLSSDALADEPVLSAEPAVEPALSADAPLAPILPHMKAASNTDSPSRGIPPAILDPGKRITGGFGEPSEGQYFPLDGAELRAVVEHLLAELHTRIQDDLRFSIALTYPRVRVHVDIVVEAYATDGGFTVSKHAAPHERTPLDVAAQHGEEVAFIVRARRQEFDEENQPADAPNAMREEAGLVIPRKQRIESAAGIIFADR